MASVITPTGSPIHQNLILIKSATASLSGAPRKCTRSWQPTGKPVCQYGQPSLTGSGDPPMTAFTAAMITNTAITFNGRKSAAQTQADYLVRAFQYADTLLALDAWDVHLEQRLAQLQA